MYAYIVNPLTGHKVKSTGEIGRGIIEKFINQSGGGLTKKSKKKPKKTKKKSPKTKHKKATKIKFKKHNVCKSGVKAKTAGNKLVLPWFINFDGTAWDWQYPQTQHQICKHMKAIHPGPSGEKRKLYKQCKKICPKKTYLGYSPKVKNASGKVTKERGWCCYKSPLHDNVRHIKKNFFNEEREISISDTSAISKSKPSKTSRTLLRHLKKYFKELNTLDSVPKEFHSVEHSDVIKFKNNILLDMYDAGDDIGKTQDSHRKFIREELKNLSIRRIIPQVLSVSRGPVMGSEEEVPDVFADMFNMGDGAW